MAGKYSCGEKPTSLKKNPQIRENISPREYFPLQYIKGRMSQKRLNRFNFVWDLTFFPQKVYRNISYSGPLDSQRFSSLDLNSDLEVLSSKFHESTLSSSHAELLVENGIASRASKPGLLCNMPFTVVEHKSTGLRQRFILWTKESNELLVEKGYVADVPLKHISEYLDAALDECASGRDFRTGFYQVEIPVEARKNFRFQTDDGLWYELTRLPMGHSCALSSTG